MALSERGRVEESLQIRITEFASRATTNLGVEPLAGITTQLRAIKQQLDQIDLADLALVPERCLTQIAEKLARFSEWFDEYIVPAAAAERARKPEMNRSDMHKLSDQNLSKWREHVLITENELFYATTPLLVHQTNRKLQRSTARPVSVEAGASDIPDAAQVWKYMPVANLIKTAQAGGFWFSSLAKLRAWPVEHNFSGVPDIREGDIPKALNQLKEDFDRTQREKGSRKGFLLKYPFAREHYNSLEEMLNILHAPERVFAWSGILRDEEDTNMWSTFGDHCRGIAIKTTAGKLRQASWRIPFNLSGLSHDGLSFAGIIMRKVQYLNFDSDDPIQSLDQCYVPFLKRKPFQGENEIRLLGQTNMAVKAGGVVIQCALGQIIDEIVLGPKADEEFVLREINEKAPALSSVRISHSQLRPR